MTQPSLVFFGSFLDVLKELSGFFSISAVYLESWKTSQEILEYCKKKEINFFLIGSLDEINEHNGEIAISASFSFIFKNKHISRFLKIFNFHPGCIYKNRGRHPLPQAIYHGENNMTLTVHEIIDENIDLGKFISSVTFVIDYNSGYDENQKRLLKALKFLSNDLGEHLSAKGSLPSAIVNKKETQYFCPMDKEILNKIVTSKNLFNWKK